MTEDEELEVNPPEMDSDWQKQAIPDLTDLNYLQKRANEKQSYQNTRLLRVNCQNTIL